MDGAGQAFQELIQFSTEASVEDRLDSVRDFLDLLEDIECSRQSDRCPHQ